MKLELAPKQEWDHVKTYTTPDRDWRIDVKEVGCVDITRFFNGARMDDPVVSEDNRDYLHVCDLDEFAAAMTKLAEETREFREVK